jgi:hypothetical protein
MGKKSLVKQISEELHSRDTHSKTPYKGTYGIDSEGTMRSYVKTCVAFGGYCRAVYGAKTIEECRQYIPAYMKSREELSPDTRKLDAAALCKLYKASQIDLGITDTGHRSRDRRTRSRGEAVRDRHISENGIYKDYIRWEKATGTRAYKETTVIRGSDIRQTDKGVFVHVECGKGGRMRDIPVLPKDVDFVLEIKRRAGDGKILPHLTSGRNKIPSAADTHGYRREYAQKLYEYHARPYDQLDRRDKYICRRDKAGMVFDKQALKVITEALGHSRLNEPVESYLT